MTAAAVVTDPPWLRGLYRVGFPLLGAAVGWLLKELAAWVAGMSWAPWHGLFKAVASIPEPGATWGSLGVGALAGLVLGFLAWQESLMLRARAVEQGNAGDAGELREELARLGVVVRDERKRQFWRRTAEEG